MIEEDTRREIAHAMSQLAAALNVVISLQQSLQQSEGELDEQPTDTLIDMIDQMDVDRVDCRIKGRHLGRNRGDGQLKDYQHRQHTTPL